jgi:hypothetical protein
MAVAVATAFKPVIQKLGTMTAVLFQVTVSGNYATGGDVLAIDALYRYGGTSRLLGAWFWGKNGFVYMWDQATKKFMVFCNTAGGANAALGEHTAAAYAAGVASDVIYGMALFGTTQG